MKNSTYPQQWAEQNQKSSWFDRIARQSLFRLLEKLEHGSLKIHEGPTTYEFGNSGTELSVHVTVSSPAVYRMILFNGSIGAGEAYMSGCWHTPDLTRVIRLLCRNMKQIESMDGGMALLGQWISRIRHSSSANTPSGSKRNIRAHYDLSNDLFSCFLDSRMMYSSAVYSGDTSDLETASENKLRQLADKLAVTPDDHVLEIGTGWGGLAIYLAQNFGCRVTTTTISQQQFTYTRDQVKKKNLSHLITVLDQDYRSLEGQFDKLVSVEMIEAVGHQYFPVFLGRCNQLLKKGGTLVVQAITIPEQRYESARNSVDFIQKYIFPGGCLPSIEVILQSTGKHTELQLEQLDSIGIDYAETLNHWRHRFMSSLQKVKLLGFDDVFIRMWEFYLCYCEGAFRERAIGTVQATFRKV